MRTENVCGKGLDYATTPKMRLIKRIRSLTAHRSIKVGKLSNDDWFEVMSNRTKADETRLDDICTQHINNFWSHYGLTLPFAVECKYENTCREAVYFGASDYILSDLVTGKDEYIKCRGAKQDDHPKKQWLRYLLNPKQHMSRPALFGFLRGFGEVGSDR